MKKFFVFCILLNAVETMAEQVEIDGLKYDLNVEEKTASVSSYNVYNGILVIPESLDYEGVKYTVTSISHAAFSNNANLLSVTIPNSVKTIESSAFYSCLNLASAKIGDGVEFIGNNAFYYSGLVSVIIGKRVNHIGSHAFNQCNSLTQVYTSDLVAWCNIDFDEMSSNPLCYSHHLYMDKKEVKELVIPEGVNEIKNYAFAGATNISSLLLNEGVTSIGADAFSRCRSLEKVTFCQGLTIIKNSAFNNCVSIISLDLPDNIKTIGEYAFKGCDILEELKLPQNLQIIKRGAFSQCNSLTNIILPAKVEFIYEEAFVGNRQTPFTVVMMAEYPPIVYSTTFDDGTKFVVPDESLELYESVSPWSDFKKNTFSGSGPEKCAEPEIIYKDGKLSFTCQTPGVDFHYTVTSEDFANRQKGEEIPVSAIYQVSLYASKDGYENSDTVTSEINVKGVKGDLTGDGIVNVADHVKLSEIIMNQNKE